MDKLIIKFDQKPKATIGFVSIPSDITLDTEAGPLLAHIPGVLWRFTKMTFEDEDDEICEEVYARAKKNIANAARSFLPNDKDSYGSLDVVAMCCTSLSFTLGKRYCLRRVYLMQKYRDVMTSVMKVEICLCFRFSCRAVGAT